MLWVRIGVYHTQFSVAYFLVSTLMSKIFDVGDRDLLVLTSGNWVIKGWVIKWPVSLRTFFLRFLTFFSKSKKNMTFYVFWVADHVFSNTGLLWATAGLLVIGILSTLRSERTTSREFVMGFVRYCCIGSTTLTRQSVHLAAKTATTSCTPGRHLVTGRTTTSFHRAARNRCRKFCNSKRELTTAASSVSRTHFCDIFRLFTLSRSYC